MASPCWLHWVTTIHTFNCNSFCLALTLAGALTPGWRQMEMRVNETSINGRDPSGSADSVKEHVNVGLFSFLCVVPGEKSKSDATTSDAAKEYCKEWWAVSFSKIKNATANANKLTVLFVFLMKK